jgi:HlyD family secretion protein
VPKNTRRIVIAAATLLIVASVVALVIRPVTIKVDTAKAIRGTLSTSVDEEGRTRIRNRYVIAAPVNGRLARIALREGDSVRAGAVVAMLSPAPLDAKGLEEAQAHVAAALDLEQTARAAVEQARAALAQASRSRERAERLVQRGVISIEERERAELAETSRREELAALDFRARATAHDVEAARAALRGSGLRSGVAGRVRVQAPTDGTVLRVLEQSERVLPAGTPLLEVGNRMDLEVTTNLLSDDALKVELGDTILVHGSEEGRELRAVVTLVEPAAFTKVSALGVEEQRVNVVGRFVDNPGRLGDRYRVDLRIVIWQGEVLKIPTSALFRKDGRWHVFVVVDGHARVRAIEAGRRGATEVQIVEGLDEGVTVIRYPGDRLKDGARVKARKGVGGP